MLMVTWKHEISILMSELTLQVKNFFCEKKHIVSSRGRLKFFSLHKDSEDTSICFRTFLFYAVMRFMFEKGKGLKNQ